MRYEFRVLRPFRVTDDAFFRKKCIDFNTVDKCSLIIPAAAVYSGSNV